MENWQVLDCHFQGAEHGHQLMCSVMTGIKEPYVSGNFLLFIVSRFTPWSFGWLWFGPSGLICCDLVSRVAALVGSVTFKTSVMKLLCHCKCCLLGILMSQWNPSFLSPWQLSESETTLFSLILASSHTCALSQIPHP